jgi:hypothetical protein
MRTVAIGLLVALVVGLFSFNASLETLRGFTVVCAMGAAVAIHLAIFTNKSKQHTVRAVTDRARELIGHAFGSANMPSDPK